MAVRVIRLGDYIERSTINNCELKYGAELIVGVTSQGIFDIPKGNAIDVDLRPYKVVKTGAFVYNPTRLNLGSIAYRTEGLCIVSHLYMVFYLNDEGEKIIDPKFLYMYFRREEFRREVTFRNFGSQRPEFNFHDMSEIEIPLPNIDIQRKYVAVYESMIENQINYSKGLNDLLIVCNGHFDKAKKGKKEKLLNIIEKIEEKNTDCFFGSSDVVGITITKDIIPTKANVSESDLSKYLVVHPGDFIYNPRTHGRRIGLGYNNTNNTYIISWNNIAFRIKPEIRNTILSEYLFLYFTRNEWDREACYNSWGSSTEVFSWDSLCDMEVPCPDLNIQNAVIEFHRVYLSRRHIYQTIGARNNRICSLLIKGAIDEAR